MTTDLAIRDEKHYLATVADVRALAERIETIGDAKSLADKARTLQVWAERARLGGDQVNLAAAAKLWAERRAGELLAATRETGERARSGKESQATTLSDLGVTKHESSRWQQLAEIPKDDFAQAVEEAAENGRVTAAAVTRLAVPLSEELIERQQRQTLIDNLNRAVRVMETPATHARAEAARLLAGGDAGPLTPSRFDRVATYAKAFAAALRKAGING